MRDFLVRATATHLIYASRHRNGKNKHGQVKAIFFQTGYHFNILSGLAESRLELGTKIICDCVVLISRSPDNEIQQDNF